LASLWDPTLGKSFGPNTWQVFKTYQVSPRKIGSFQVFREHQKADLRSTKHNTLQVSRQHLASL